MPDQMPADCPEKLDEYDANWQWMSTLQLQQADLVADVQTEQANVNLYSAEISYYQGQLSIAQSQLAQANDQAQNYANEIEGVWAAEQYDADQMQIATNNNDPDSYDYWSLQLQSDESVEAQLWPLYNDAESQVAYWTNVLNQISDAIDQLQVWLDEATNGLTQSLSNLQLIRDNLRAYEQIQVSLKEYLMQNCGLWYPLSLMTTPFLFYRRG